MLGQVQLKQPRTWSEPLIAIVDTGAPYSVIPASVGRTLRIEPLFKTSLRGIAPGKRAKVDAILAKVDLRILDAENVSPTFRICANLAKTERVPLILGWHGLLDRARLIVDVPRRVAYLQI